MDNRMDKLKAEFDEAMRDVYRRGKDELNYNANYLLKMIGEHGGVETARYLLAVDKLSDGFVKLWRHERLDLSVECLVLNKRFRELFNDDQLKTAHRRLRDCKFDPGKCEHANR